MISALDQGDLFRNGRGVTGPSPGEGRSEPRGNPNKGDDEPWYRQFGGITAAELVDLAPTGVKWLVPGLLPKASVVLLTGQPKKGKTFLAMDLALSVAEGSEFLGRPVQAGRSVVCNFEDGHDELSSKLQRRCSKVDAIGDRLVFVHDLLEPPTQWLEHLSIGAANGEPTLIVIDPLVELNEGGDENDGAEMAALMRPLRALAQSTGATVVVLHHNRKSGGGGGMEIRGSSAIFGASAGQISLDGTPSKATLTFRLRSVAEQGLVVAMDDGGRWGQVPGDSTEERILEALRTGGPQTYQQLGDLLGMKRGTLTNLLPDLQRRGVVDRRTPQGQAAVWSTASVEAPSL